jgi:hypothetical protein
VESLVIWGSRLFGYRVVLVVVNFKMETIEVDAAAACVSLGYLSNAIAQPEKVKEGKGSLVAGYDESDKRPSGAWDTKQ